VIVKNKDGTDRVCVDYRALNKSDRKDLYLLPIIEGMFQHMVKFKNSSKIDLRSTYHLIRKVASSKKYTTIRYMLGTI
jgi:hypothetical protein